MSMSISIVTVHLLLNTNFERESWSMENEKNEPLNTVGLPYICRPKEQYVKKRCHGMQPEPMNVVKLKLNDLWSSVRIGLNMSHGCGSFLKIWNEGSFAWLLSGQWIWCLLWNRSTILAMQGMHVLGIWFLSYGRHIIAFGGGGGA